MRRLVLLFLLLVPALAVAAPDRAGLIKAWESAMRHDGALDAQADGEYHYRNESLGYDGRVKLLTAIVQTDRLPGGDVTKVQARGTVDFDLPDLPTAPANAMSIGVQSWKSERESFLYDADKQVWLSIMEWAKGRQHGEGGRAFSWLLDWMPIGLVVIVVIVFWGAFRIQRRAGRQLTDSADIGRRSRETIERAAKLQDEQKARTEESLSLARRNTALLESILEELRKRP